MPKRIQRLKHFKEKKLTNIFRNKKEEEVQCEYKYTSKQKLPVNIVNTQPH